MRRPTGQLGSQPSMQRARGFSLIELCSGSGGGGVLAFVTVPLASGWIRNAQLERDFAGLQRA